MGLEALVSDAAGKKRITQAFLAHHLNLSERSVRELFAKYVFAPSVNPKFLTVSDLDSCRVHYIEHLRAQAAGRSKEDVETTIDDARNPDVQLALLRAEQIALTRVKRLKAEGEVIDRKDMILAVSTALVRVRNTMLKIPKKHAGTIVALEDEIEVREYLDEQIRQGLDELASTPVETIGKEVAADDIDLGEDTDD